MFNSYNPYIYSAPKTFSFTGLLNGASKTLNVINQALPIYKEVKPIFKNARTLFNVAKGLNSVPDNNTNNTIKSNVSNNGPSFFI